jgi:hypothetical protein
MHQSYTFTRTPTQADYEKLSAFIAGAADEKLHPSLHAQRGQVAARLTDMAQQPSLPAHRSAYQMLRLFVY